MLCIARGLSEEMSQQDLDDKHGLHVNLYMLATNKSSFGSSQVHGI